MHNLGIGLEIFQCRSTIGGDDNRRLKDSLVISLSQVWYTWKVVNLCFKG
jgi:hypothetical protein